MIYCVTIIIKKKGNITNDVPKSMRHLLEIVDKQTLSNGIKYRKLFGWLNQKQFDRLVVKLNLKTGIDNKDYKYYNTIRKKLFETIEFISDANNANTTAFVTPLMEIKTKLETTIKTEYKDFQWQRILKTVSSKYK